MLLRQISISFGIAALLFAGDSSLSGQSPSARIPVPTDSAQAESMKLVKEVYGGEYDKAKTPVQKTALAEKLLQKAGESKNDPASHYVMLRLARDIAAQAGDANAALRAVDAMDSAYQVDAYAMKVETLVKAAKAACLSKQYPVIVDRAKVMLEEAVAKDDFDSATQLAEAALAAAKSSKDLAIVKQVTSRNKEVEEIGKVFEEEAKEAIAKLKKKPIDPDTNLAVGKYLCFFKGQWDRGVPKLALGSDEVLKSLGIKELMGTTGSNAQAVLGDGWWELAEKEKEEGIVKKQLQGRAGYWYRQALPGLVGLVKDKVERRLQANTLTVRPTNSTAMNSDKKEPIEQVKRRSLENRLHGTKWVNTNRVTYEWDKTGTLRRNGEPIEYEVLDEIRIRITFSENCIDTFVFDKNLKRFQQFSTSAPGKNPLHTGQRVR